MDDDEYWEPYLVALEELYHWCYGTVKEAMESYAGMVQKIRLWQAVEEVSNESLSYVLEKPWKYKYLAIRLLWNEEVDAYSMQDWLSPESVSLLENFNPEGRDYEGEIVYTPWNTSYPELKVVRNVFEPSWLPSEDWNGRWSEPYAFELFDAESYKPPASAVSNAKRGLELRKEYGRGGLSPAEAKSQGIDSGVTRARKISSGKVSKHDVRRMSAFNRHRKNYRPEKKMPDGGPTAGTIAWLLWGGTSGVNWAKKKSAAMNAESISGDPWDEGSLADKVYKLLKKYGNLDYWDYRRDDGYYYFDIVLDPYPTELGDFAAEDYNSFTEDLEELIAKYGKLESYDTEFKDNLMDVSFSFRPHDSDFDDVDFDAERYRQDYMVPADVHKIMEAAIHLQKLHEQHEGSYPEWWKSKLSVVASELDNLVDVLDYKVDHPEEFDAEVQMKRDWLPEIYFFDQTKDQMDIGVVYQGKRYAGVLAEHYLDDESFDAEEIKGDEDIKVGDVVRSYDFCLGGIVTNEDCYVEGIVEKIEPVEWCGPNCDHYHIKTIRRIFNGKPTTYEDYYFPVADPQQSAVRRVARWSAEDWGGDPEGILAKALSRARMRNKEPRKPLKIEKLPHPDQKSLKDFEAVVIPKTSGYAEQAAATRMAIEESEQQQKLLELQTLLKLKILSPEDVFAMMLGE